jgi:hypothetical protein
LATSVSARRQRHEVVTHDPRGASWSSPDRRRATRRPRPCRRK